MVSHAAPSKSLEEVNLFIAMLHDVVNTSLGAVFSTAACSQTIEVLRRRCSEEGLGFLTKTLPRLGKALDKALSGGDPVDAVALRFDPQADSKLPLFLGELFNLVLNKDGVMLPDPEASSVGTLRDLLYCFYKYEVPYSRDQELDVVSQFEKTEHDLEESDIVLVEMQGVVDSSFANLTRSHPRYDQLCVVRRARRRLSALFSAFDPTDITPRHGPGAVATKQKLWAKYQWSNVSSDITYHYPLDAYFFASVGHVCDDLELFNKLGTESLSAKVVLVPKDSRGPRLISEEPVDYQWVQQGLGRAIVQRVESHPLTRGKVNFTDQTVNRDLALRASINGEYATLDLKEASDRVSVELVRLLFPSHIFEKLEACRSHSTLLPDGRVLRLRKFAPMGSSLCFPTMALTIWAILTAATTDRDIRKDVYVYGDDVIVPTAYADNAISVLESFGLKVNRDKSCTKGLFRESCGMDAIKGVPVTPVRFRTVWESSQSPDVYSSWISYANSLWDKRYYAAYDYIVSCLVAIYGGIPTKDLHLGVPSLASYTDALGLYPIPRRVNSKLQKLQYRVWSVKSPVKRKTIAGWSMLLRFFTEGGPNPLVDPKTGRSPVKPYFWLYEAFRVRSYTPPRASMLVRRWR